MSVEIYRCEVCKGEFTSLTSDAEAVEEFKREFGRMPPEDRVKVCEVCYRKVMAFLEREGKLN